ncbi:MAG TPA: A24 family peptidase [Nocardioidaceae bacterium]|nr:A24 family peptidase [Nocardioidaceae bacterium]
MPADSTAIAVWAVVAGGLAALGPLVIRRLPEPILESDAADKIPYHELGRRPGLWWKLGTAGAAAGAAIGWRLDYDPIVWAWVYLAAVGVVLGYIDSQTRLLPTRLIVPSYVIVTVLVVAASAADDFVRDDLIRAALGLIVMGGFYRLMYAIYPAGMGFGDVRLSGVLGIALGYIGWGALLTGMYAGFLLGGVGGGLLAVFRVADRRRYPFGPFMLLGALVGLLWGQAIGYWYSSF